MPIKPQDASLLIVAGGLRKFSETYGEIFSMLTHYRTRYYEGKQCPKWLKLFIDTEGTKGLSSLAWDWTKKFNLAHQDTEWEVESFYEKVEQFAHDAIVHGNI